MLTNDRFTVTDGTEIYFKDWGAGQPLFFHHGWPLTADDWDAQMMFFLSKGYRVIAHDRRGHGRSTQTPNGHDMDTYAADVARYVARHGNGRVSKAVLLSAVPPFYIIINADLLTFISSS
jgi:non-heme chloroperoxidase